ncbi:hypothetical protein C7974DRAFT_280902, partial [Boeremia exigua]|uniref:uncharacterized protein n=1 Tax=Boeremia exigua TaxID=749465 RepID=UPI001E8D3FB3
SFLCINTYPIDIHNYYSASSVAGVTIIRSVLGAIFPLFGLQVYGSLDFGWGNSLLGLLS